MESLRKSVLLSPLHLLAVKHTVTVSQSALIQMETRRLSNVKKERKKKKIKRVWAIPRQASPNSHKSTE